VDRTRRPTEEQVSELTEKLFAAITSLLPAKYLGTYTESGEPGTTTNDGDNPGN
jgi:hypothetical protein